MGLGGTCINMIGRKILYYPTILVPSLWLKWAMLYWDKVSSIVPSDWQNTLELVDPRLIEDYENMDFLQKEGLFEPTRPADFWREHGRIGTALEREFRQIILSENFLESLTSNWEGGGWTKNPIDKIHSDKISDNILAFLDRFMLVKRDEENPSWFFLEEKISRLYMSLLAKHLADVDPDYTVTGTNVGTYERVVFESDDKNSGFPSFRVNFLNVLPIPRSSVSAKDILKFKKKREDELLHFREVIDEYQKEISHAENPSRAKQISVQYKEKIQRGRSNLNKLMKSSGMRTAFAHLNSLIDIKSPVLAETLGFSLAKLSPIISVPIIAGTAFIRVGYTWIQNRNKRTANLRESPFSYLYHAVAEKII